MKYHENQNMSTFFIRKWDPQVYYSKPLSWEHHFLIFN